MDMDKNLPEFQCALPTYSMVLSWANRDKAEGQDSAAQLRYFRYLKQSPLKMFVNSATRFDRSTSLSSGSSHLNLPARIKHAEDPNAYQNTTGTRLGVN